MAKHNFPYLMDGSGFLDGMPCFYPIAHIVVIVIPISVSTNAFQVCLALTYHTHTRTNVNVNIGAALNFLDDFLTDFY